MSIEVNTQHQRRRGQVKRPFTGNQCAQPRSTAPRKHQSFSPQHWHSQSPSIELSSPPRHRKSPFLKKPKKPLHNDHPIKEVSLKQKLIERLQEQDYFKLLCSLNTRKSLNAQNDLVKWFGKLIGAEDDLQRTIVLQANKDESKNLSITPFQWFDLLIQDKPEEHQDHTLIPEFANLEKLHSPYRKGKFYELRFNIAKEVLRGLGFIKNSSRLTKANSWLDLVGIDALIDCNHAKKGLTLPIQIKSSEDKVNEFFNTAIYQGCSKKYQVLKEVFATAKAKLIRKKQTNRRARKFYAHRESKAGNRKTQKQKSRYPIAWLRKNILAIDMSQFSISNLVQALKKLISKPSYNDNGYKSVQVGNRDFPLMKGKTVSWFDTYSFNQTSAIQQKQIIGNQYLTPTSSQRQLSQKKNNLSS